MHLGMICHDLHNAVPYSIVHMSTGQMKELQRRVNIPRRITRMLLGQQRDLECHVLTQTRLRHAQVVEQPLHNVPYIRTITNGVQQIQGASTHANILVAQRQKNHVTVRLDGLQRWHIVRKERHHFHRQVPHIALWRC